MTIGFGHAVPAFKYVATGKRVPEKDFSTLGKLFSDKKAVTEFLDLWCSAEIVRDVYFEGIPDTDLTEPAIFGSEVCLAVGEYHMCYGLVPILLAWQELLPGAIAVARVGGEKVFPHTYGLSCNVPLSKEGYQGDRYMSAVRGAIGGFVVRDDETFLHLLNQTESDVEEVSPKTCKGTFPVVLFVRARKVVWEQAIPVPTVITTPQVLRELFREEHAMYLERPTSLVGMEFGSIMDVDLRVVEPLQHSMLYPLGCENIDTRALYALGPPATLGVRHVRAPLQVKPATVAGDDSLLVWAEHSTWLQGKAVGKVRAQL